MSLLFPQLVLVTGAAGSVGAHVLAELLARGVPVRASVRRPEPGRFAAGLDVRAADLTDPSSPEPAPPESSASCCCHPGP